MEAIYAVACDYFTVVYGSYINLYDCSGIDVLLIFKDKNYERTWLHSFFSCFFLFFFEFLIHLPQSFLWQFKMFNRCFHSDVFRKMLLGRKSISLFFFLVFILCALPILPQILANTFLTLETGGGMFISFQKIV